MSKWLIGIVMNSVNFGELAGVFFINSDDFSLVSNIF